MIIIEAITIRYGFKAVRAHRQNAHLDRNPHVNRYEIFLKVAECGNITKCAQAVHYTQAGVSHAIATLEKETGLTLFARTARGVTLTENGRHLLPSVQALVNDQHALAQTINQIGGVVAGTLRVGTFTSVSMQWLPRIIQAFTERYPQVEFDLQAGDYDQITEMLMTGKVDCGFLAAPAHEGLEFSPLYRDPMLAFLPKGHPLARKRSLTLDDLLDEELIIPAQGSDNDINAVLNEAEKPANIRYVLNDDFSVLSMVEGGLGVAIMPELILKSCKSYPVARHLSPRRYRTIGIASLPKGGISMLAQTFIDFLVEDASARQV